mmetsp:Transcript_76664/g.212355  ORF Transcript_76664/g.212355 Transcript_76664/m.212355 type:complete len:579 (+) Transcript_76664:1629-3365(+)
MVEVRGGTGLPPAPHVEPERLGQGVRALAFALGAVHAGDARGDEEGQQFDHGVAFLRQQPGQQRRAVSRQSSCPLDAGLLHQLPGFGLDHVRGLAPQTLVRLARTDDERVVATAVTMEAILEQLRGQMGRERGQGHVGPQQQFGLDGRDAVRGQAAHQLLGMHCASAALGQADERGARRRFAVRGLPRGLHDRIAIFRPDQPALDLDRSTGTHEHYAAGLRHQIRRIHRQRFVDGVQFGLQPFVVGFQRGVLVLIAVVVRHGLHARVQRFQLGFELRMACSLVGVRRTACATHFAMTHVVLVDIPSPHIDPFPAFGSDLARGLLQLVQRQPFEQRGVLQVGFAVVAEQVAPQRATRGFVGGHRHEDRHAVAIRLDLTPGQQAAQLIRTAVPFGQLLPQLLLPRRVIERGQHHQAVQTDPAFTEQRQKRGRHRRQLESALHDLRRDAEGRRHVFHRPAAVDQSGEGRELVGRVQGLALDVLDQAGHQRLLGRHHEHRHRLVLGPSALLHEQRHRAQAPAARTDLVHPTRAAHDDKVVQKACGLDGCGQFGERQRRRRVLGPRLVGRRQHELVERNEAAR